MQSGLACLAFGLLLSGSGCGASGQHPLTLVSTRSDSCKAGQPTCEVTYNSCSDLGISDLAVEVGVISKQARRVGCPASLVSGQAQVQVDYQPGQDFYMVDVSYPQNGSTVYITAGPFGEDDSVTPWTVTLR